MPSLWSLIKTSFALNSLSSPTPDSVSITSPTTGEQLIGYFSGWTSRFDVNSKDADLPSILPLTVFTPSGKTVTCAWVKEQVEAYHQDDIFEELFLYAVYLKKATSYERGLSKCLKEAYGTEVIFGERDSESTLSVKTDGDAPNGPYLASFGKNTATLGPVYRIYQDDHMAFMSGLLPNGTDGAFRYATANTISDSTVGIPVPSRLYTKNQQSKDQPLKGLRVTVKDIIDIKGVKTSQGNRAWFKLYDAKDASAPGLQKLIDLGADIIGKTKTAQFANSDRPTADWVDYHDAFNPRGDGYQDPGVSSAGAGASTGAYDWVDVSIATDTGGSIRIPAGKNGVFGLRPSFGAVSNEGVLIEGSYFDSVGYHSRSPYTLRDFGKAWLSDSEQMTNNYTSFPRKLIVPGNLWPVANNASQELFTNWIAKLSTFLNATVETAPIGDYWNATAQKPDTEFASYMQMVGFHLIWKNQLEKVITPFREDYAAANGGRTPFINPFPAARYLTALNTTQEDFDTSYERFQFFKEWFGQNVVKSDPQSCSESLFLIPMATGDTSYRNNVYSPPDSQGPEVVFPIGEVPYQSTISGVEEKLPVAIDLLAHRNCDLMLLDLAKALADDELLKEVKAGRTLW
ncbi:amidase signature enzyme [Eremomyces bilateralis CBS 781.70]|uniref:Amidase signature enzyme n=1 Tax=Eremomyces bilateralis CBS 781.70 TaxID=1392243 RepID=A0A6G1FWF3_9PEZI|nr:amidase signature enzyme [Eremomyces bilateralis CBS 781.70]KAF1810167.1 amidase signature enzyme [Eremomyces bilateralis CBS 781.70]